MVELATAAHPLFDCSDMEVRRCGPTYTADTVERLGEERRGCAFFLIAGLDALAKFHMWERPADMLGRATIVGIPRPGFEQLDRAVFEQAAPGAADRAVTLAGPMTEISSTDIRERTRLGRPIEHLVPGTVWQYILDNRLYMETEAHG